MTRKTLPRAMPQTGSGGSEIVADAVVNGQARTRRSGQTSKRAAGKEAKPDPVPEPAETDLVPVAVATTPDEKFLLPVSVSVESQASRRRAMAEKIVDRYKLYAAFGGLSPLPILNVAGVATVIVQMAKTLSSLYEMPFQRDRARTIVIGILGSAAPTGLGVATASTLALAFPGSAFVGVAVSALTAAALTGKIGLIFIDQFENGEALAPGIATIPSAPPGLHEGTQGEAAPHQAKA
jgi:uncharacterized protein (DUF697 family)